MTRETSGDIGGRSTIRDVAARAGVSASTVSRVLGGEYSVSTSTRTRVMRAVRELDYVADARAKAVAGVGTPTLAFVLDDITGPSFTHMAHGVEREATRLGHLCLVCSTEGDAEHQLAFIEMMRAQRAAAVILVGGGTDTAEYRESLVRIADSLASAGSRLVLCGRPPLAPGTPVTVIEYDNESGAHTLCSHLLAQGHRRVLFLGGRPENTTAQGREQGYLSAHSARSGDLPRLRVDLKALRQPDGAERRRQRGRGDGVVEDLARGGRGLAGAGDRRGLGGGRRGGVQEAEVLHVLVDEHRHLVLGQEPAGLLLHVVGACVACCLLPAAALTPAALAGATWWVSRRRTSCGCGCGCGCEATADPLQVTGTGRH
ncbi:LacI family DNA-binding transcriptional regulator [Streptomyces sp. NPDC052236]|uniref:LacI family DNA-binding transcriptional regulator n=1 Tax=Streptomyces sp. NPDC052236 TaxID=3365686 RepID=UPI0037D2CDA3